MLISVLSKKSLILFIILLLAFLLRFWRLGEYPALNADEAAIGYNAFTLLETGKDEHGNSWPIHFQSFNDYKPGLYFYLVLPFVKFLGLNEWSVRIPGALMGVATVYLVYLLSKKLFPKKDIGYFASFILAISPWHIHFSRGGWEVNTATFFIVLGLLLYLKGLKNIVFLFLSVFVFSLSLYTYHAARIVVPLFGLGLLVIYRDSFRRNIKNFCLAGLVGLVALLPLVKDFTRPEISSRAAGVGLFADTGPLARINEQRGEHTDYTNLTSKLLHNKAVNYGLAFLENWSEHYHGLFLFVSGEEIQRNAVPETGQMYLFDILFLIAGFTGIVFAWRNNNNFQKRSWQIILWWLLIAPIPAALTFQSPHALRAHNMIIPLIIISAFGLEKIIEWGKYTIKNQYLLKITFLMLILSVAWQFSRYLHIYWIHMAKEYPFSSQYGVKELAAFVKDKDKEYDKVIVTDRYDQPYILFLFYLKYSAVDFQKDHDLTARDRFGFSTVKSFDKYEFSTIEFDTMRPENPNSLIIGTDEEIPAEANIVKEIYGINGYKYFEVVAN